MSFATPHVGQLPATLRSGLGHEGVLELIRKAGAARVSAYAPYSQFRVGAALISDNGGTFVGCNVENASYGLTICAERSTMFAMIAGEGALARVRALAIVCEPDVSGASCGACLQVLAELGPNAYVYFPGPSGSYNELPVKELLPIGFTLGVAPEIVPGQGTQVASEVPSSPRQVSGSLTNR
jgi:cytidine deaminase